MKKFASLLASLGFAICLMGFLLLEDLNSSNPLLYGGIILIGIISLVSLIILIVNYKVEGVELFSKTLGKIYIAIVLTFVVFYIAFSIYKARTGYKTKKEIMIENYNRLIEQNIRSENSDSTMVSDTIR
ncbi:hypothetical protein [Prolixibacter denitrificans]|uniref:Uncharacterized protein n=1 Tax=Prolixibacter denitrificans TaxID=1541063 RepID=A0A2P8C956_9BACT|nr:hypothetical protein [Prolixibacter denitrificans]PSK81494.1 hypothetical protein CLV93_109100 [Prolixibacter denitrificans]GET21037.1 hypothetical protein JCM18694_12830 [Prolixibacter denitrificans]